LRKNNHKIERIPPSPDFEKELLAELPPHPQQGILRLPEAFLDRNLGFSHSYQYLKSKLYLMDVQSLYHRFDGEYSFRLSQLKCFPEVGNILDGWNFPRDLDMDAMFLAEGQSIPAVFQDALAYTAFALTEFKRYSAQDGFSFLLVATDSCTFFPESWLSDWRERGNQAKRTIDPKNFIARLKEIADSEEVEFLDLYPDFSKLKDIREAHLFNDNHWNEFGHKLAGETMAAYIVSKGWIR
jgi:hypothetical protein